MFSPNGIITLTTDFGLDDAYVAIMKGVIMGIAPRATIVDYTHGVAPGNITEAAYLLRSGNRFFPPGTTHVVVVDPGVGSERRAIALATPAAAFVGPDNGVLSLVAGTTSSEWGDGAHCVELTESRFWLSHVSATFHGRDVFAPVGAHLASGVAIDALGPPIGELLAGPLFEPAPMDGGGLRGAIVHVDRFGNCITNISREHLLRHNIGARIVVEIADQELRGLFRTYTECPPGVPICMIGSSGHLELAVANGSATEVLGVASGNALILRPRPL